jgi:hypothetical protein
MVIALVVIKATVLMQVNVWLDHFKMSIVRYGTLRGQFATLASISTTLKILIIPSCVQL